jgi:hypothetical protein
VKVIKMEKKKEEKKMDSFNIDLHDLFATKDGKYYVRKKLEGKNDDKTVFVEVDEKEYTTRVNAIAEKLVKKSGITAIEIVAQAIRYLPLKELDKIERNFKKRKPVTIEKGCVELKTGNVVIPIC